VKLWLNENDFVELNDKKSLAAEIAPRSRSFDWMGIMGLLPDPDPVLAKLGLDITVYRQLLSDAHVWSCVQSRKSGTLSCEYEIREPAKGGVRTSKKAHQMIEDMMDQLDVYQIITDMLEAPFFGMSPIEVIWQAGSAWLPERIVGKPPEWFAFDADNRLRFLSIDNMVDGEELPPYKFLLPRHHATYQNPYGERVLSRCFWPVTFKRGGFKFWAIFTEKYGMPWIIGKVPRQTNDTERGLLLTRLVNMVQDAVAVINNDESVEITEAAGKTASADIYEKLISVSNREISKAILGQTLTTELDKGGSFAATKEHMEVRADLVDQDKRMVSAAFNRLFSWVTELNFSGAVPPVFAFYEEEDIQKDRSDRDTQLTSQGVRFKPKYYQRTYNLEEDDFELAEPGGYLPDNADETTTAFAERVKKKPFLGEIKSQQFIDSLADKATAKAASIFENYIKQVKAFLGKADTLKTAKDRIIDLYDDLDAAPLTEALTEAIMGADKIGTAGATGGSDFVEAFWGPGQPFEEAVDYFKAKAFYISGIAKADLLSDIKTELIDAMETGITADDFKKQIDTIFEKHGWSKLHPYRIDTIFRTNMQSAYQVGRYRQMTTDAVLAVRPYWRYVAVLDGSTRPEHAAMHGKIFKNDHPFWDTWYPPNGFNCRCTVQTVSEREIKREAWNIETKDPTGVLIEPVDPVTGAKLPARPMMPDPGWDKNAAKEAFNPDLKKYEPKLRAKRKKELKKTDAS
jgi:SPP1 gp7 family putative phage head morphogenesis protein